MEGIDDYVPKEAKDYYKNARHSYNVSPENEIVEIVEEHNSQSKSFSFNKSKSRDHIVSSNDDVYVAVGKDDLDVVKWALDHLVSHGARLYLVHIYPPITFIPTPVGKLSRSQLTYDQVRFYLEEEENRRRNLLQKYMRLCNDAKVNVDTVMIEHHATAKAIVDLIPIHNIINLVIGMKKLPNSRILRTRMAKSEYVKKNAPEFCEVSIVHDGKKYVEVDKVTGLVHSSQATNHKDSTQINRNSQRYLFLCWCFSGKSY